MSGVFKYLAVRPNFYISIFVSHGANLISVSNGFPTLVAHTIKNEQESTVVEEFHGEQWMTVGRYIWVAGNTTLYGLSCVAYRQEYLAVHQ